jgi:hypothetical protein
MTTLADALRDDFTRSWYEAVAIVQEVASRLAPGEAVPLPDDLFLAPDGSLTFGFANEAAGNPVSDLAALLQKLLEGTQAPVPLRELAAENASADPKHTTIEGFSRALAFYERPARSNDIVALAGRLTKFAVRVPRPEEEFERLRQKLAGTEEPETEEQEREVPKRERRSWTRRQIVIAGAVACVVASIGLVAIAALPSKSKSPTSSVSRVVNHAQAKLTNTVSSALGRLGAREAEASSTAAAAPAVARRPVASPRADILLKAPKAKRPASDQRGSGSGEAPVFANPSVGSVGTSLFVGAPLAADPVIEFTPGRSVEPVAPAEDIAGGDQIYSSADRRVRPPLLLRPQLPSRPVPGADTGYFDIIVDENGVATAVSLMSPVHHFHDGMLVAAAKAWMFRPALLNGRPVKYRIRIPITGRHGLQ